MASPSPSLPCAATGAPATAGPLPADRGGLPVQEQWETSPSGAEEWETSPAGAERWETSPADSERWETSPPGSDLGAARVLVVDDGHRAMARQVREVLAAAGERVVVVGGDPGGSGGFGGFGGLAGSMDLGFSLLANKLEAPPVLDPAPAPGRTGAGLPARKGPTGRGKTSHKQHARAAKRRRS